MSTSQYSGNERVYSAIHIHLEHPHLLAGMLGIMYTRLLVSLYTGINHILVVVASSTHRIQAFGWRPDKTQNQIDSHGYESSCQPRSLIYNVISRYESGMVVAPEWVDRAGLPGGILNLQKYE